MHKPTQAIQQDQRNIIILVMLVMIAMMGFTFYFFMDTKKEVDASFEQKRKTTFASPLSNLNEQALFLEKTKYRLDAAEAEAKRLEGLIDTLEQTQRVRARHRELMDESIERFHARLDQFDQRFNAPTVGRQSGVGGPKTEAGRGIQVSELPLYPEPSSPQDTPHFIPAGSIAQAVLLGGLDAPAGVTGRQDPKPVILRILGDATLPGKQKQSLKDCRVTAAGIGDVSAERGYIRTERMSCYLKNGEQIDVPVYASVFGPDGKAGIRGIPVWRESAQLQRAAFSGLFSGFSDGLSNTFTTSSISPLGETRSVNSSEMLAYGLSSGASNALEKLAEYHIKRAEQYQPIIQIPAGTKVDIVFLKGLRLAPSESDVQRVSPPSETLNDFDTLKTALEKLPNNNLVEPGGAY